MITGKHTDEAYGIEVYTIADPSEPGQNVGTFGLRPDSWERYEIHGPSLWAVRVWEEFQGQGHGNMLMHDMTREARNMGLDSMTLIVDANNSIAKNMYEKHGFEVSAYRLESKGLFSHIGDGVDVLWKHIGLDTTVEAMSCLDEVFTDDGCPDCSIATCSCNIEWRDLCDKIAADLLPYLSKSAYTAHQYVMRREL